MDTKTIEVVTDPFHQSGASLRDYVVVELVERIQLPDPFPQVELVPHNSADDWIEIDCGFCCGDFEMVIKHIKDFFVEQLSSDILELLVDGDKSNSDDFLRLIDGLKIRTQWPRAFQLSELVVVRYGSTHGVSSYNFSMYLRVVEP